MDISDLPTSVDESNNENQHNVTSFANISYFLSGSPHKYPDGLSINQKRTLRKAAANFEFIEQKLYYTGKSKKEKRLVILDEEGKQRVFRDCHNSAAGGHWGQKKTLEKIESLFFWRGMVKDIVTWVQSCPVCQQKEERRMLGSATKKLKTSDTNSFELVTVDLTAVSLENADLVVVMENTKELIRNLQQLLHSVQQNEQQILTTAQKAEHDIDEVLDDTLAKFIKLVTNQKRTLKEQVEKHKNRALVPLRQNRKQLENRLKLTKKLLVDTEAAIRDNQSCSSLISKSSLVNTPPETPRSDDSGSLFTVFTVQYTQQQLLKIISESGYVCPQSPYRISAAQQCPAALRLSFDVEKLEEMDKTKETREKRFCPKQLRIYYCTENATPPTSDVTDNLIHFNLTSLSSTCYLNHLQPHVMYSIYLSHKDEGSTSWSAWGNPYIASTSVPSYSWDAANGTWLLSDDHCIATKILNTPTALYSSAAQYFPGCSVTFTILDLPAVTADDGVALVEQWVQGGTLCQEGTVFLNASGQLFIDGKFYSQLFGPIKPGVSITWNCDAEVETITQGLRLRFSITMQGQTHTVHWNLRSQITNVYFGALFATQGTRVQIE